MFYLLPPYLKVWKLLPKDFSGQDLYLSVALEWTQNLYQHKWTEERISNELQTIIINAFNEVKDLSTKENMSYRQAAFVIGIAKVVEASKLRGFLDK